MTLAPKIFSVLGNPNSLIPMAIKDSASCAGMTAGSLITGKEEGVDRLIDEVGTGFLWLGGIPAYKYLFDKTVFPLIGLDAKIDVRNLKNKELYEHMKKYAPSEEILKNLEKAENKKSLLKKVAIGKFLISTVCAAITYLALTKLKQEYTEKKIRENLIKEYKQKQDKIKNENQTDNKYTSFKGGNKTIEAISNIIENIAFSPVNNMCVMDGFITSARLKESRNSQELFGYAIKEASCLFFLYYAGQKIQNYFENHANKKFNKNISLDSRIIESNDFKESFKTKSIEKSLNSFKMILPKNNTENEIQKSNLQIYEFLHNNPDNEIVKLAKQTNVIQTYKKTGKIDTRKYINLDDVKNIYNNIEKLYSQYNSSLQKGENIDIFFKSLTNLKRKSVIFNIGSSILALGILTPAAMLLKRMNDKSGMEFETKKRIKEKLIKEGVIS